MPPIASGRSAGQPLIHRRCLAAQYEVSYSVLVRHPPEADHHGFGESAGRPSRIIPGEQIDDVRTAALYLSTRDDIDGDTVGLLGVSFGGAIAVAAAAAEPIVRATVSCAPFSDGAPWMRDIRRYWEWIEFCERLERGRRTALTTGRSEEVDPDEILVRDPESIEWNAWLKDDFPSRTGFSLSLANAQALLKFRPRPSLDRTSVLDSISDVKGAP